MSLELGILIKDEDLEVQLLSPKELL